MIPAELAERDRDEIRRSAEESRHVQLKAQRVERYLHPPVDTPYPLEYAFYLLGDVRGRTVLDFGCGSGENIVSLATRGARVIGLDISPELIDLARARAKAAGVDAAVFKVASGYDTGLQDCSVDVIFCIALIHHLDIAAVREEMLRILRPDGFIVASEPIRFSKVYDRLRKLLPEHEEISDHEHPLTKDEFDRFTEGFTVEARRHFRIPLLPLFDRLLPFNVLDRRSIWSLDQLILRLCPLARRFATNVTMRLRRAT